MALEIRPKKPRSGQPQKWVARFQIPTGKRSKSGKLIYKNHSHVLGERGKMTKRQAEDEYDKYKSKIRGGKVLDSPTLEDFAFEYLQHKKEVEGKKSVDRDYVSNKNLIAFFGPLKKFSEFTPRDVDRFKASRLKDKNPRTGNSLKPATVNRDLEVLRAMFNQAEIWGQFEGVNPVSKAKLLKEIREEPIPVSYEEEEILIPALVENISWICEFDLNTGMRIGEVIQLKEKALSFNKRQKMFVANIEATEQKGKKFREVPLNDRAMELIEISRTFKKKIKSRAPEIFVNLDGKRYKSHDSIYPTVIRTCKKLGLRNINPHLFRHTFITRAIENGANPIAVREVVGHADLETLMKYTHLSTAKFNVVKLLGNTENTKKTA